jgi:hypothetical protein
MFDHMNFRTWTDEQLITAVKNNQSMAGTLVELSLKIAGGNRTAIKIAIIRLNLVTDHWTGKIHNKNKSNFSIPFEKLFCNPSHYHSNAVKRRALAEGLLENKCSYCDLRNEWQNKPITLQLDHINGQHNDNRIENLRILCPNCHSQTETFCGRNLKGRVNKLVVNKDFCIECGGEIYRNSTRCRSCVLAAGLHIPPQIELPSVEELRILSETNSITALAKVFNTSRTTIRKKLCSPCRIRTDTPEGTCS